MTTLEDAIDKFASAAHLNPDIVRQDIQVMLTQRAAPVGEVTKLLNLTSEKLQHWYNYGILPEMLCALMEEVF